MKGSPTKRRSLRSYQESKDNSSVLSSTSNTNMHKFDENEMNKLVIWRRPIQTVYYFVFELVYLVVCYVSKLFQYRKTVLSLLMLVALVTGGFYAEGSHLNLLLHLRKKFLWCLYWVGLGVASSIGLGTGLHTFLLYLGPFIAQVTLAAYECNSMDFPEPPFPEDIICPNETSSASGALTGASSTISILSIMSKVRLESFMWGAGTAIGELPPYFMARASALSSKTNRKNEHDEDVEEFEHLLELEKSDSSKLSLADRMRLSIFKIIKRVGFMGILLCASIPNPLFDLAGITCGHFLVPFWTFFGATLIGKAVIKMHLQKLFVIFIFSQHHLDTLFTLIAKLPYVGHKVQPLFEEWLNAEKTKLHRKKASDHSNSHGASESVLSWVLNKIVLVMILFFVVSIVNSLAQQRYKRITTHTQPSKSPTTKVKSK